MKTTTLVILTFILALCYVGSSLGQDPNQPNQEKIAAQFRKEIEGNDGPFRKKGENGGDGGKVYCPQCEINGNTGNGGDGGWFRKRRSYDDLIKNEQLIKDKVIVGVGQDMFSRFKRGMRFGGEAYCRSIKITGVDYDNCVRQNGGGNGGWF